jgi:hypothetical protein
VNPNFLTLVTKKPRSGKSQKDTSLPLLPAQIMTEGLTRLWTLKKAKIN